MNFKDNIKKLNILFLPAWYPNKKDVQLGIFIKKHALSLSNINNVSVFFLTSDYEIKKLFEIEKNVQENFNETIIYFYAFKNKYLRFINFFIYLFVFIICYKNVIGKKNKPDLVISYIIGRTSILAYFLKLLFSIPFIIFEQSSSFLNGKFENSIFLYKQFIKFFTKKSICIIAVSELLKSKISKFNLNNQCFVVPNIVESVVEIQLDKITLKKDKVLILSVADLNDEIKNISSVILAINFAFIQGYSIEYHIIGGGKDILFLQNIAKEHSLLDNVIFFHGRQDNNYVLNYMNKIDFLITNSNYETFSVVTAEALACGKPVISTKCGGPESFVNSENGILIDVDDFDQLKNAIITMLNSYKLYNQFDIKSKICSDYSYENISRQFNEIINSLIYSKKN